MPVPVEPQLHERFAHFRVFGEWFDFGPDLRTYIESLR